MMFFWDRWLTRIENDHVIRSMEQLRSKRSVAYFFQRWMYRLDSDKAIEDISRRREVRFISEVLHSWSNYIHDKAAERQQFMKSDRQADKLYIKTTTAKVFDRWCQILRIQKVLGKIRQGLAGASIRDVFSSWRTYARHRATTNREVQMVNCLISALGLQVPRIKKSASKAHMLSELMVTSKSNRLLSDAFKSWRWIAHTSQLESEIEVLRKAASEFSIASISAESSPNPTPGTLTLSRSELSVNTAPKSATRVSMKPRNIDSSGLSEDSVQISGIGLYYNADDQADQAEIDHEGVMVEDFIQSKIHHMLGSP